MAEQVMQWKSENGKIYKTELEAVKADVEYWKKKYLSTVREDRKDYVGPGGGRSNNNP